MMPVIASQRVLFLMIEGSNKFDTSRHQKGNWSGTTVRSVQVSFSSPKLEREGFFNFNSVTAQRSVPTIIYEENWHGTFRGANPH